MTNLAAARVAHAADFDPTVQPVTVAMPRRRRLPSAPWCVDHLVVAQWCQGDDVQGLLVTPRVNRLSRACAGQQVDFTAQLMKHR